MFGAIASGVGAGLQALAGIGSALIGADAAKYAAKRSSQAEALVALSAERSVLAQEEGATERLRLQQAELKQLLVTAIGGLVVLLGAGAVVTYVARRSR